MTTDWRPYVTPLDSTVDGFTQPLPVSVLWSAPAAVDVTSWLDDGEDVVNATSVLRKLPATGESDYTDVSESCLDGDPTVDGTIISQRFVDLVRGEVYRWEVTFGPSQNRRGPAVLIEAVE